MVRSMRRGRQALSDAETRAVFERGTSGVLAVLGDEGYPYAVPMSYAFDGSRLIFHSAVAGHKIDAIVSYHKASFCVIDRDEVIADEYTTQYTSAIAFGRIRVLEGDEAADAACVLGEKYRPGFSEEVKAVVARNISKMCVFVLEIEQMTGKQAKELV